MINCWRLGCVLGLWSGCLVCPASPEPQAAHETYVPPKGYVCYHTKVPIQIDGKLDDAAWKAAPWTDDFIDIEGARKPSPRFRTRAKMLWDDTYFYIAAEMEEPHVWGTLIQRDSVIFQDNDFEVFIDPNGDNHEYYEFEINALNTGWDLLLVKPYKDGGPAVNSWEIPGLKTAVHVQGTLNDPRDRDTGWTVELAFPWHVLRELARRATPPSEGDQWRVNFSRVEWLHEIVEGKYRKVANKKEDNWVWSSQGTINMHRPETWGYVQFSSDPSGTVQFREDPAGPAKHWLHQAYYAQHGFRSKHKRWAATVRDLGLPEALPASMDGPPIIERTQSAFEIAAVVKLPDGKRQTWHIRQDSLLWRTP